MRPGIPFLFLFLFLVSCQKKDVGYTYMLRNDRSDSLTVYSSVAKLDVAPGATRFFGYWETADEEARDGFTDTLDLFKIDSVISQDSGLMRDNFNLRPEWSYWSEKYQGFYELEVGDDDR